MRSLFKTALSITCYFLLTYTLLYGVSLFLYPQEKIIDTEEAQQGLYRTIPSQLVFDRHPLERETDKVLIIGASNSREGLRPHDLKDYFPNHEIHNLSLSGGVITSIRKVVDLAYERLPKNNNHTFILGVTYSNFVNKKNTYPQTQKKHVLVYIETFLPDLNSDSL